MVTCIGYFMVFFFSHGDSLMYIYIYTLIYVHAYNRKNLGIRDCTQNPIEKDEIGTLHHPILGNWIL